MLIPGLPLRYPLQPSLRPSRTKCHLTIIDQVYLNKRVFQVRQTRQDTRKSVVGTTILILSLRIVHLHQQHRIINKQERIRMMRICLLPARDGSSLDTTWAIPGRHLPTLDHIRQLSFLDSMSVILPLQKRAIPTTADPLIHHPCQSLRTTKMKRHRQCRN